MSAAVMIWSKQINKLERKSCLPWSATSYEIQDHGFFQNLETQILEGKRRVYQKGQDLQVYWG